MTKPGPNHRHTPKISCSLCSVETKVKETRETKGADCLTRSFLGQDVGRELLRVLATPLAPTLNVDIINPLSDVERDGFQAQLAAQQAQLVAVTATLNTAQQAREQAMVAAASATSALAAVQGTVQTAERARNKAEAELKEQIQLHRVAVAKHDATIRDIAQQTQRLEGRTLELETTHKKKEEQFKTTEMYALIVVFCCWFVLHGLVM